MKNLMPVVLLIAEGFNVVDFMGRNTGGARYAGAIQLLDEVGAISAVDFSKVDDEFKEALKDPAKWAEVKEGFNKKFDIEDDQLELVIEEGLVLVKKHVELVKEDIEFFNKLKSLKKS